MRGAIGRRLSNPNNGFSLASIIKQTPFLIQPTSHFSSSSDGAGRGRGRGSGFLAGRGQFGINREPEKAYEPVGHGRGSSESKSAGGYGHGGGRPIQSDSISPAFSSFVKPDTPSVGRGRGSVGSDPVSPFAAEPHRHQSAPPLQKPSFEPRQRSEPFKDEFQGNPVIAKLQDMKELTSSRTPPPVSKPGQTAPPNNMFNALGSEFSHPNQRIVPGSGAGRGKPFVESAPPQNEDNRRIQRLRPQPPPQNGDYRPIQCPQPPPQNGDYRPIQCPQPPPQNGDDRRILRPQPPPQNGDDGRIQCPQPPSQNEDDSRILRPQPPPQNVDDRRIQRPQLPQQQQHQRPQPHQQQHQKRVQPPKDETPRPQLSPEEAGRRARSQLSVGEAEGSGLRGRGGGRGRGRGRGARGRGRGRGGEGWRDDKKEEEAEQEALSIFVGDSADGEKFSKKMGPEIMNQLAESYESICERALPSTAHDALVDAYDTNLMIECEPEYLMPDFGSNPDIDEKPPMSLRECLEKVKPFIVAYEGIKDQEEWEEAIDEVMAQAPLIKEIVDHYSGPDRVTAKKQNEELDRIATTVPQSAPDSVKRFADRAALSLKSNPGWGFEKKYQFMDKLILEVSQSYK